MNSALITISWILMTLAVVAGVCSQTEWFPQNVIQWSTFIVSMTTALNQFLLTSVINREKIEIIELKRTNGNERENNQ